ncbi:hypothetical protein AVEN_107152-1 [Araneus ventricosus]|uniref:Uncharacterized protein n=1 Tax=Araneus ventricosus TaxID=182803 RepID=A0A4Y2I4E6_ARAVE|nr:hypothetical protein AVEN_107152-1 [Araneus ventricosus]
MSVDGNTESDDDFINKKPAIIDWLLGNAFNRPHNFESWSNDENDTRAMTLSPKFHATSAEGHLTATDITRTRPSYSVGLGSIQSRIIHSSALKKRPPGYSDPHSES